MKYEFKSGDEVTIKGSPSANPTIYVLDIRLDDGRFIAINKGTIEHKFVVWSEDIVLHNRPDLYSKPTAYTMSTHTLDEVEDVFGDDTLSNHSLEKQLTEIIESQFSTYQTKSIVKAILKIRGFS